MTALVSCLANSEQALAFSGQDPNFLYPCVSLSMFCCVSECHMSVYIVQRGVSMRACPAVSWSEAVSAGREGH